MSGGGFWKKLVGIDDEDEELEITKEELDAERARIEESYRAGTSFSEPAETFSMGISKGFTEVVPPMAFDQLPKEKPDTRNISMNRSSQFKMVIIEPKNLDECRILVDQLRARKPVIVNLERVETELARYMFQFLSGATYALGGDVQKIASDILIFAPQNVEFNAMIDRQTEAGKPEISSPW